MECLRSLVGVVNNLRAVEQAFYDKRVFPAVLVTFVKEAGLGHGAGLRVIDTGVIGQLCQTILVTQLQLLRRGHKGANPH